MAHQQQVATDKELSDVAMYLSDELKEKGSLDKAKKYVELAAKFGFIEVKCVLASLIINDKNASSHDLVRALGYFEESALQGNVDHQRFLAQVYRRDQQWCASSARIVADLGKAYAFVNMLLKSNPYDIEGRYILGYLLGTHGGKAGIPAGQTVMAYELLYRSKSSGVFVGGVPMTLRRSVSVVHKNILKPSISSLNFCPACVYAGKTAYIIPCMAAWAISIAQNKKS
jgi:hypothetical protein